MSLTPDLSGNSGGVDADYVVLRDGTPAYPYSVTFSSTLTGAASMNVQGATASGTTTIVNPLLLGARYNTSLPTYAVNGQLGELQLNNKGLLCVTLVSNAGGVIPVFNVNGNNIANAASTLGASSFNLVFNGTGWDQGRKPNLAKRITSSAAAGNPDFLKATAGELTGFWGVNTVASLRYLQVYNKTSAPVIGTDTPILTYPIAASAMFTQSIPNGGMYFNTGVAFAFTTDAAGTTAAAAGDITACAIMGA